MFYVTQFMSVTVLLYPLSSILMSRFVLNLRQFNQMDPIDNIQSIDIASPEIGSSVRFASSIIAGMGAPVSNDSYLTTGLDDGNGDDLYTTMAVPESVIGYVPVGRGSLDEESPRPPHEEILA
ncbi:hypothetical protein A0H81_05219 [Grifola frondosa]|uniref:Uncharacterized protein n=1 Tax=Grifola frondosa TaxID=5627 RepID=A0A1C7MIL1_GRIFR|nr:hypothetical protein A0H81_05219 [Grifola frondosa]